VKVKDPSKFGEYVKGHLAITSMAANFLFEGQKMKNVEGSSDWMLAIVQNGLARKPSTNVELSDTSPGRRRDPGRGCKVGPREEFSLKKVRGLLWPKSAVLNRRNGNRSGGRGCAPCSLAKEWR